MKITLIALSVLLLMIGCTSNDDAQPGSKAPKEVKEAVTDSSEIEITYRDLAPEEFAQYVHDPNAMVLDVRTEGEWKEMGTIPEAITLDWYDEAFEEKVLEIPKDKAIYVYCAGGGRSSEAAERLIELGWNNVYNLQDGFKSWQEAGMPIAPDSTSNS